ncbi:MAG: DUF1214 domain-containing protein [bacterium]
MRRTLWWGSAIVAGLVLGLGSAQVMVRRGVAAAMVRNGAWQTSLDTGSAAASPYLRAQVAVAGLLALNRDETIYFRADRDESGHRFDGSCDVVIDGSDPAARWWSITAYAEDNYLIANPEQRYSFSQSTVQRQADGQFRIIASPRRQAGNWLPVAAAPFDLTLRLYNPAPEVGADPAGVALPRIRQACP